MKAKIFTTSFIILFLQLYATRTFASHIIGTSITYEYTGTANQYTVTLKLYRDCSGIPAPTSPVILYSSSSASLSGSTSLILLPGSGLECQPSPCVAGNGVSSCLGGTNFGMEEYIYQGTMTLPQQAADWILSYYDCCRNGIISTLASPGSSYIFTTLDNLNFPTNSSPQFITPPFAQYCLNTLSTYSFTCMDPDGDSLVYSLSDVFEDANTPCIYILPYSGANPVSSSTALMLDPVTGSLTFTPNLLQVAVIGMLVQEYRNGVLVGETRRDDEISIVNGILYSNNITGDVFLDNNSNQVFDAGDQQMHGTIVEAIPGPVYSSTFYTGLYSLPCLYGTYTVSIPNIPLYYVATPAVNTATFSMPNQTDPNNDFALSAPYNAQDLRVVLTGNSRVAPGASPNLHITYANVGTTVMSGSVNFAFDNNFIYSSSSVTPANIAGNVLTWNFSNLLPSTSGDVDVILNLPSAVPLTTPLLSYADISPLAGDSTPTDNSDTLHQVSAGPFDPNEKTVKPDGFITTTQIQNGLYLDYTVFFQNTGNAPAINVIIADTLDQNLNIPTFQVLSASHPYTWSIRGNGIIEFRFDNINLPDSFSNEPASHGFIRYRVKPDNGLVTGNKIMNTAYIVFDTNVPVMTNSTSTTIIDVSAVNDYPADLTNLQVYPNPANEMLHIELNSEESTQVNIQLYDAMGLLVKNVDNSVHKGPYHKQINLHGFAKGFYFLKLTSAKGITAVKVVVE